MGRIRIVATVLAARTLAAAVGLSIATKQDDEPKRSADEQFAENVCATAIPHKRELLVILDSMIHTRATPGIDSWAVLLAYADRARDAARAYSQDLQLVPLPETVAGRRARRYFRFHARDPLELLSDSRQRIATSPKNMTLIAHIRALNRFQSELVDAMYRMGGGILVIPNVVPDLADDFERAASCKKLDALWLQRG